MIKILETVNEKRLTIMSPFSDTRGSRQFMQTLTIGGSVANLYPGSTASILPKEKYGHNCFLDEYMLKNKKSPFLRGSFCSTRSVSVAYEHLRVERSVSRRSDLRVGVKSLIATLFLIIFLTPVISHASLVNVSSTQEPGSLSQGLVGHWTFDAKDMVSNVADRSGSGNTGYLTGFGATSTAVTAGKLGQGLKFDGVNDYVTITQTPAFALSGQPFSVSLWWKDSGNTGQRILSWYDGTGNIQFGISSRQFYITDSAVAAVPKAQSVAIVAGSGWHHAVGTSDGTTYKVYLDGVISNGSWSLGTVSVFTGNTTTVYIGRRGDAAGIIKGHLDDLRIYSRALSASEVQQLYNMGAASKINVSPTTAPGGSTLKSNLVGHWTFDAKDLVSNVADKSNLNNTGYLTGFGATSTAVTAGKIGQGLRFDGVNDYVKTANYNFINARNVPHSMFAWVYYTATTSQVTAINYGEFADTNYASGLGISSLGQVSWTNGTGSGVNSTLIVPVNKWSFIGFVRTADTIYFYLNNTTNSSASALSNTITTTNPFTIGNSSHNTKRVSHFAGYIDDPRVYSRALSASEVKQLYNMGAANKVNVSSVTASSGGTLKSGLVGHWTFDAKDMVSNVADRSGSNNTGYLQGFGATSTAVTAGKLGQGLNFTLPIKGINLLSPASLDDLPAMTISGWVRPRTSGAGNLGMVLEKSSGFGSLGWYFALGGTASLINLSFFRDFDGATNLNRIATASIPKNQWSFITMTWDGSGTAANVHIYKNGVESTYTTTTDGDGNLVSDAAQNAWMGGNGTAGSRSVNGLMDDVRIYSRVLSALEIKQLYNMGR